MKHFFTGLIVLLVSNWSLAAEYTVTSSPTLAIQVISISPFTIYWDTPQNARNKDGAFAQSLARLQNTNYQSAMLNFSGFDFSSIPSNAAITGIMVTITRRTNGGTSLGDRLVQLSLGGDNKAKTNAWTQGWEDAYYGGSSDLWGSTFSISELQTIGVNVTVGRLTPAGTANQFPQIDGISMTVTYTTPLPIELIEFKGKYLSQYETLVEWSTASEVNNSHFILSRSFDGEQFEFVAKVNGVGYAQNRMDYSYRDQLPIRQDFVYYEMQQVDYNGSEEIYGPVIVRKVEFSALTIYPNPSSDFLFIESSEKNPVTGVLLSNLAGQNVVDESYNENTNLRVIDIRNLKRGCYHVRVFFSDGSLKKQGIILN